MFSTRALMTQRSCAVGMRNAKLGNHFRNTRPVASVSDELWILQYDISWSNQWPLKFS